VLKQFGKTGVFVFIACAMLIVMLAIGLIGLRTKGIELEKDLQIKPVRMERRVLYANREHRCGRHPRLTELNPASEHGLRLSQFAISMSHCRKSPAAFPP
jgi:hypothetical protein